MKCLAAVASTACRSGHSAPRSHSELLCPKHREQVRPSHAQLAQVSSRAPAAVQAHFAACIRSSQLRRQLQQRRQPPRCAMSAVSAAACACRARRRLRPGPDSQQRPHQSGCCTEVAAATSSRASTHPHCSSAHPSAGLQLCHCRAAEHHHCIAGSQRRAHASQVRQPAFCVTTNNATQCAAGCCTFHKSLRIAIFALFSGLLLWLPFCARGV